MLIKVEYIYIGMASIQIYVLGVILIEPIFLKVDILKMAKSDNLSR